MGPAWDCAMRVVPRLGQQVALWLHAPSLQPEPQTHAEIRSLEAVQGPGRAAASAARPRGDRGRLGDPAGPSSGSQVIKERSGLVSKQPVASGGHRFSHWWPGPSASRPLMPSWPSLAWEPLTGTRQSTW